MPTFAAILLASITALATENAIRSHVSVFLSGFLGLVVWYGVFWAVRHLLRGLRGDFD